MIAEFIDPAILGFILIGVMLFSIFVGFPISFTLIFLGFVFGYLGFGKLVFYLMTLQFSMVMTEQTLAAVPLFVFMGIMMEQAGLMERLFSAFQLMLAKVRGSLYYAVLFVSVIFAAATGIVGASVTILGIMAAKSMNRSGYNVRLAAGTITAGGTLGILIPPSISEFNILKNNTIEVGSGMLDKDFTKIALENEIGGMEFLSGIPGNLGGAIAMNAGCYGFSTADNLKRVLIINKYGKENLYSIRSCWF